MGWGATTSMLVAFACLAACSASQRDSSWPRPTQPLATPEGLIDATDLQSISDIAWRYGEASWNRDGFRDPLIRANAGGIPYRIEFYGCEEGRDCTDLRLVSEAAAGKDAAWTPSAIATWNTARRFGKITRPQDKPARVEMNLVLQGGVTQQNLDASFDWWTVVLAEFAAGPKS